MSVRKQHSYVLVFVNDIYYFSLVFISFVAVTFLPLQRMIQTNFGA